METSAIHTGSFFYAGLRPSYHFNKSKLEVMWR